MQDLDVAAANHTWSLAYDINNLGHIALTSGERAYLLRNGQWINLPGIGAHTAHAYAINDSDVVAGSSTPSGFSPRALLWENGITIDLTSHGFEGIPSDINSAGAVAGGRSVWFEGALMDLSPLVSPNVGANSINDRFQVSGATYFDPAENYHAFLWTNGTLLDVGGLVTTQSTTGEAVNIHGDVVGLNKYGTGCPSIAFLYTKEQGSRDLLSLVASDTKWRELYPRDMNDLGQIVGWGQFDYSLGGFLMTTIYADYNQTGETDFVDIASFVGCMGDPDHTASPGCVVGDVDRDGDVDLFDFWVIQRFMDPM